MKQAILTTLAMLAASWSLAQGISQIEKPEKSNLPASTAHLEKILADYAKGTLSVRDLNDDKQSPLRRQLIAYYQSKSNQFSVEQKFVIAVCMVREDDFSNAASLAEEYVAIHTNDYRGWTLLGTASGMINQKSRAVEAYQHAVALGDERCLPPLVGDALDINRLDIVRENLPKLLKLKGGDGPPSFVKLDVIGLLVVYARRSDSEETFLKALDGVKAEDLLARTEIIASIEKACKQFKSPNAQSICQKVDEAVRRKGSEKQK